MLVNYGIVQNKIIDNLHLLVVEIISISQGTHELFGADNFSKYLSRFQIKPMKMAPNQFHLDRNLSLVKNK